ncbi:MAG: dienelactone hydrolase family protein [Campylobacterota bacterium]|nr:dienelactone hydrolase family protein [Campylobacterota bacterium]
MKKILMLCLLFFASHTANAYEEISFPSQDGLKISAFLSTDHNRSKPFILLFHQAHYSRGEYIEIMPKLNAMGFNVMAPDLRNGNEVNGIVNDTSDRAFEKDLDINYIATVPDIEASIAYAMKHLASGKLLLWGSSYSASLVLLVADHTPSIDAVLAFAPGEYYKKQGKTYIQDNVSHLNIPVFITSAKEEKKNWWSIYQAIPSKEKVYFLPQSEGVHGAKALWDNNPSNKKYWKAVSQFLEGFMKK